MKLFAVLWLWAAPALASTVFTPSHFNPATARMVVVIHGCLQSAESMAIGTGWNRVAEKNNLVVVYPQVPEGAHPLDCWGWYLPENQKAESGQLRQVMEEIRAVRQNLKLKRNEIYLAGISSGAATVTGLLACFPDAFRAGAIHSGPSYGLAQNLQAAEKVLKEGPPDGPGKGPCQPDQFAGGVLVIQGKGDLVVNPLHGLRVIADFVGNTNPILTREFKEGEVSYTISDFTSSRFGRGRLVMVEKLDHAWSGFVGNLRHSALLGPKGKFPTVLPFFSEIGPNATNLMWQFFQESSRRP